MSSADLRAAFAADLGGRQVAFNCDAATCALSEVWTAWAADPLTLAPTSPLDYGEEEPCACSALLVTAWTQAGDCPAPPYTNATTCVSGVHGPNCNTDADCADAPGCVRCAGSGYCTDIPS